jgi:hypothetical protein
LPACRYAHGRPTDRNDIRRTSRLQAFETHSND